VTDELDFYAVDPAASARERRDIRALLGRCGLDYEEHIQVFVVCRDAGRLVACAGLESNIVKCCAIDPDLRGGSLSLTLLSEVVHLAYERGHSHLFLYTRPENVSFFQGCGFYALAEVPGYVTLMENTPVGIRAYCDRLRAQRPAGLRPDARIGGIVINANPFTLGHQYLVRLAAAQCDWLHLFVVSEDVSFVSYRDRYALVEQGVRGIERLTLHHGSQYMVSRATFPDYFFKEKGVVGDCCTAIDLLLFRNHIAPALGITHRFVGTEPFCETTRKYNADMKFWLQGDGSTAPAVTVIEEARTRAGGTPISASEVRRLLRSRDLDRIRALVPAPTFELLREKYLSKILPFAPDPLGHGGEPDAPARRAMAAGM